MGCPRADTYRILNDIFYTESDVLEQLMREQAARIRDKAALEVALALLQSAEEAKTAAMHKEAHTNEVLVKAQLAQQALIKNHLWCRKYGTRPSSFLAFKTGTAAFLSLVLAHFLILNLARKGFLEQDFGEGVCGVNNRTMF